MRHNYTFLKNIVFGKADTFVKLLRGKVEAVYTDFKALCARLFKVVYGKFEHNFAKAPVLIALVDKHNAYIVNIVLFVNVKREKTHRAAGFFLYKKLEFRVGSGIGNGGFGIVHKIKLFLCHFKTHCADTVALVIANHFCVSWESEFLRKGAAQLFAEKEIAAVFLDIFFFFRGKNRY